MSSKPQVPPVPENFRDPKTNREYGVGRLLGKGGFARVHKFTPIHYRTTEDGRHKEIRGADVAGKVVAKVLLTKSHQKEKMTQEIALHKSLQHENIVQFYTHFETDLFVIITLELCARRSLMELHKRRGKILEPEARFYMIQVQKGVLYLHNMRIVHRDLKLGNVFLDEKLVCKIGDFGLAAQMDMDGTQRRTMCGTPNYLAPEILQKKGHDYQVDIWSSGCMLFTLICGKPPFETNTLKETYNRIKTGHYRIPTHVSKEARTVIKKMLADDPQSRPSIADLINMSWFSLWTPTELPTSALSTEPRFDEDEENVNPDHNRQVSQKTNLATLHQQQALPNNQLIAAQSHQRAMQTIEKIKHDQQLKKNTRRLSSIRPKKEHDKDCYGEHLPNLIRQLELLVNKRPDKYTNIFMDDAEKPQLAPLFWITKWVDFQEKYGFGYALSEGHYGVNFRDDERTVLNANGNNLMYINKNGIEHHYNKHNQDWPEERTLIKKIQLTDHFINYMRENLLTAGASRTNSGDDFARIPYLQKWLRVTADKDVHALPEQRTNEQNTSSDCIGFLLTNGTFQCNFHNSHIKVIICPLLKAVTFLDYEHYTDRTFGLEDLIKTGCNKDPFKYLRYCYNAATEFLKSHQRDREREDRKRRVGNTRTNATAATNSNRMNHV